MHLEGLWEIPVVQRHHGLNACCNERIREVAVKCEPSRVDLQVQSVSTCGGWQHRPCTRISMGCCSHCQQCGCARQRYLPWAE